MPTRRFKIGQKLIHIETSGDKKNVLRIMNIHVLISNTSILYYS
jgi:hypothetical protein